MPKLICREDRHRCLVIIHYGCLPDFCTEVQAGDFYKNDGPGSIAKTIPDSIKNVIPGIRTDKVKEEHQDDISKNTADSSDHGEKEYDEDSADDDEVEFVIKRTTGQDTDESVSRGSIIHVIVTSLANCDYCTETQQLLEEVISLNDKVELSVHDIDQNPDLAGKFNVTNTPGIVIAARDEQDVKNLGVQFSGIPAGRRLGGHSFRSL